MSALLLIVDIMQVKDHQQTLISNEKGYTSFRHRPKLGQTAEL